MENKEEKITEEVMDNEKEKESNPLHIVLTLLKVAVAVIILAFLVSKLSDFAKKDTLTEGFPVMFSDSTDNGEYEICGGYVGHDYECIITEDLNMEVITTLLDTSGDCGLKRKYELQLTEDQYKRIMKTDKSQVGNLIEEYVYNLEPVKIDQETCTHEDVTIAGYCAWCGADVD
jgi:hypothetical protein